MKKVILITLTLALMLSLTSCFGDFIEYQGEDGKTYYYAYSEGVKSITNYHPYKLWELPTYQELVQYGEGVGLENEGVIYIIYIVDTSVESTEAKAYYTAEFDGETKELLYEDGEYFSDETEKNATVERLLYEIDTPNFK